MDWSETETYMSTDENYIPEKTHLEQLKGNLKKGFLIIGVVVLIVGIIILIKKRY